MNARLVVAVSALYFASATFAFAEDGSVEDALKAAVQVEMVSRMLPGCASRFPQKRAELDAAFAEWQRRNADRIRAGQEIVTSLPDARRMKLNEAIDAVHGMEQTYFDVSVKADGASEYCKTFIERIGTRPPSGWADATDPKAAVGLYMQQSWTMDRLATGCSMRYPEIADEMAERQQAWKRQDSAIIRDVEARWADVFRDHPSVSEAMRNRVEMGVDSTLDFVAQSGAEAARRSCVEQISSMTNGESRKQRPRMYEYLEHRGSTQPSGAHAP